MKQHIEDIKAVIAKYHPNYTWVGITGEGDNYLYIEYSMPEEYICKIFISNISIHHSRYQFDNFSHVVPIPFAMSATINAIINPPTDIVDASKTINHLVSTLNDMNKDGLQTGGLFGR